MEGLRCILYLQLYHFISSFLYGLYYSAAVLVGLLLILVPLVNQENG